MIYGHKCHRFPLGYRKLLMSGQNAVRSSPYRVLTGYLLDCSTAVLIWRNNQTY